MRLIDRQAEIGARLTKAQAAAAVTLSAVQVQAALVAAQATVDALK
jgi:hypothetical protein